MAVIDDFEGMATGKSDPGDRLFLVTKSNSDDLPHAARALVVAADATAKVMTLGGDIVENYPLFKGFNPGRFRRVYSTGTDNVSIWAWY
jgi:hypothetical protein